MSNDEFWKAQMKRPTYSGARNKKNGSKSKKCSLPSDNLTQSQLNKKNGDVKSYNLKKPMTWQQFVSMPVDIQKQYVEKIIKRFNATPSQMAKMFGVVRSTVYTHFEENGIKYEKNRKMTNKELETFKFWYETSEPVPVPVPDSEKEEAYVDAIAAINLYPDTVPPLEEYAYISTNEEISGPPEQVRKVVDKFLSDEKFAKEIDYVRVVICYGRRAK